MSYSVTPSKRPRNQIPREANGKGKLAKIQNQQLRVQLGSTIFRLLCPISKIGGVIGKAGSVISKIRQDTGAKVKVEDLVPGCDERVIVIGASDKETEVTNKQLRAQGNTTEEGDGTSEHPEVGKDNQPDTPEGAEPEKDVSSMIKALLLIFERMVDGEKEMDKGDKDSDESSTFVARLLVLSSQLGFLLGKGGNVIELMSSETGTQIHILPRDKLPPCISASDELVQITGGSDAVRKALQFFCQKLLVIAPADHDSSPANFTGLSSISLGSSLSTSEMYQSPKHSFHAQGAPFAAGPRAAADCNSTQPLAAPKYRESGYTNPNEDILTFRLLCHEDNVGSVIGKGGAIINTLQHETGCEIKVLERVNDSEDRIIVISGPSHPDDRISASQDAVLRVQTRIVRAAPEVLDKKVTAKIIVPVNQMGCLLGYSGSIIDEMRSSGAFIQILEKEKIPKCASENEEVIQINGEFEAVQEALFQITARLQQLFLRDAYPYMGREELSSSGMYSNSGPPFHKFDASSGVHSLGGFYSRDDHSDFMQTNHEPAFPSHISGRYPATASWGPQVPGGSVAVRNGPQSASHQLLGIPPRDHDSFHRNSMGLLSNSLDYALSTPGVFRSPENSFHDQGPPFAAGPHDATNYPSTRPLLPPKYRENGPFNPYEDILTFRLLCHEDNVGGVIGKGGAIIKTLHHETGCEIKVLERINDSEDRIIVISGPAHPDEKISAPQDAVLCVQTRIVRAATDTKKATAKIIVPAHQIGCLLGKGGSIIAEMRKSSGAFIRILPKDQIPKCASENEEVIQMNGEFEAVQGALFQITARLKQHFFRDAFHSANHSSNPSFHDQVPPFPLPMRRELSPPGGMHSSLGPPFHKFDAPGGLHPHGGFYPHDDSAGFMLNKDRPAFPSHISGENPSATPWDSQGHVDVSGREGYSDYAGAPPRRIGEYGGASHCPIITNATMKVIVPRSVVSSIYGENGGCLEQIRQISDAKITIPEPKSGAKETVIEISGTPEQAHAAQSLIQAFVMCEAKEDREG